MPDFDKKSIPILDDIIDNGPVEEAAETEIVEEAGIVNREQPGGDDEIESGLHTEPSIPDEPVTSRIDNSIPDRLTDDNTQDINSEAIIFNESVFREPETDEIAPLSAFSAAIDIDEDEPPESALTDDQPAEESDPVAEIHHDTQDTDREESETINTQTEAPSVNAAVRLDPVIDDIVRQLLPELEQQLRFLIRQTLEDRLSEDILQQLKQDKD